MSQTFKHDVLLRLVKIANVILITIPFALSWFLYYSERMYFRTFYRKGNWVIILLFLILYVIFGKVYDAFLVSFNRISEMIYSQSLAAFIADALMFVVISLLTRRMPNLLPIMLALFVQILLSMCWCFLANQWYFRAFVPKRTLIVYDMREGIEKLIEDYGLEGKFDIQKTVTAEECLANDLKDISDSKTEVVYLCGVHSHDRNTILKYCISNGITAYVIPRIGDVIMSGARKMHMFHLPVQRVERYHPGFEYAVIKRIFDILLSLLALVILSPVYLITAIAIKAEDGGPILYRQIRLTKNGRLFQIMKFRSMRVGAEKDGVARLSTGEQDDRITKVGHFIRSVRIDELPQLINILRGEMSIVGPRPERPEIAKEYEKELPEFSLRLQVKAGLTGLAQVFGKYNSSPYDKLMMDLMYIANASILQDLRIMIATVKILFLPESTEGVDVGQVTALDYENEANRTEKWEKRDEHWVD